jgi:hypothetical protein
MRDGFTYARGKTRNLTLTDSYCNYGDVSLAASFAQFHNIDVVAGDKRGGAATQRKCIIAGLFDDAFAPAHDLFISFVQPFAD